jgi:RNA recognition motif-containing protein
LEKKYFKVIIAHLPLTTSDEEFETIFMNYIKYIYYWNIVKDIKTKECLGYGFVFFSDYEKGKEFINETNGKTFKNIFLFYIVYYLLLIIIF